MQETKETTKIKADTYYSLDEAKKILGYKSVSGVIYLIDKGYLPNTKVARGTPNYKVRKILGQDMIDLLDQREI